MDNVGKKFIEDVLNYNDHQSSEKERAVSTTTLLGADWKAKRDILKDIPKRTDKDPMYSRSSSIGTGFHMYAEKALNELYGDEVLQEVYAEKYIEMFDVWISGKFDLLASGSLMDFKTSYGKAFPEDKLEKARKQMSIYRWLNDGLEIDDDAYALFISQSVNAYESYPLDLIGINATEVYVKDRLTSILAIDYIDCKDNVKYNPCLYCDYDEKDCKKLLGSF